MSKQDAYSGALERMLEASNMVKKADMDRRQLMLRTLALGAAGVAGVSAASLGTTSAFAQEEIPQDELVTMSQEQQQVWIKNFNPLLAEGSVRWPTHCGIYEPLLIFNVLTGETTPWLAESWEFAEDGLTLTYKIRTGVNWSDGKPLTAKDAAFTFNFMKEHTDLPGAGGARFVLDSFVDTVEAPDDTTLVFTFTQAFSPALWDLGETMVVPEHVFSAVDDPVTFTNETPVGSGPFTEVGIFQDQYWELHANPAYWQEGKPMVKGFRFPAFPSNDAANLANIGGETDWFANFIPDIDTAFVAKDPDHNHYFQPATGDMVMLYLNTTVAPFDDVNVRKAISMGIDRANIVELAMYDYTAPGAATGLGPAYDGWKNDAAIEAGAAQVTLDVEAANALLDEAGLAKDGDWRKGADGKELSYKINVVSGWSDWVQSVQIIAQNMEELGIKVEVEALDFAPWFENVTKGDFTMSIGWSSGGPTPFNFYRGQMSDLTFNEIGTTSNENWQRYVSEAGTELINQFAASTDEAEQKDLMNQLQQTYVDEYPSIPLFPGPQWGQYNSTRFDGFPNEDNPYSILSSYAYTERLLVMTTITPNAAS